MAKKETVPLEEAREQVEIAITRLALLHLSFAKTLVEEFGEEKGKKLIIKSILEYGRRIGERIKRGKQDLPKYGVYGEHRNGKTYDCVFAKVFQEYDELDLGCLYCYVDAAKSMTINYKHKLVHKDCAACGDDYCTFVTLPTTEKERIDFINKKKDWEHVDPRLVKGINPSSSAI